MLSKKYLIIIFGLVFVGAIISLTWFGGPAGPTEPTDGPEPVNNENGSDLVGIDATKLPAGVNIDGILAPTLLSEHSATLDRLNSYTLTITTQTTVDDETTVQRTTYKKGPNSVHATTAVDGETLIERYADLENGTLYERRLGEDTQYTVKDGRTLSASNERMLSALVNGGDWDPTRVEDADENEVFNVTLQSTTYQNQSLLTDYLALSSVTAFNGSSTIADAQYIRELSVTVEGQSNSANATVSYDSQIEAVNQTLVSQPEWTTTAEQETTASWVGMSGDRRIIHVSHRGGQTFEAGTTLDMYVDEGDTYRKLSTSIPEEFAENDTLYLTVVDNELQVYANDAPDQQGDELTDDAYYVEFIPPGDTEPALEFEVQPPER